VHAGFGAQPAVGVVALELERGALDAGDVALGLFQHFGLEALALAVAQVHAQQHAGPVLASVPPAPAWMSMKQLLRVGRVVEHAAELEVGDQPCGGAERQDPRQAEGTSHDKFRLRREDQLGAPSGQRVLRVRARIPDRFRPRRRPARAGGAAGPARSENLYVGGDGKWDARYVPAFVRRYPFVPGKGPQGELLVCIDEASSVLQQQGGRGPVCGWQADAATRSCDEASCRVSPGCGGDGSGWRAWLHELGLLRQADSVAQLRMAASFASTGSAWSTRPSCARSTSDAVQELFANGSLAVVYAHLMSLGNLGVLVDRLSRRGNSRQEAAWRPLDGGAAPNRPPGAGFQPGGNFPL
jgi:hypothetical protein